MKKILCLATVLLMAYSNAFGLFSFSETIGPNDYRTTYMGLFTPITDKTKMNASYVRSSYSGSWSRTSYGLELKTKIDRKLDAGAGFIISPEPSNSKYNAIDASVGYNFGKRNLKARLGLFGQFTLYDGLNQLILGPSIKLIINRKFTAGYSTSLFSYSKDVSSYSGSADSWSLRNNTDMGSIISIVGDFPSQTNTLSAKYRIVSDIELYGELSSVSYERSIASDSILTYGGRYFLNENIAFSANLSSYDDEIYTTIGFGVYW